MFAPVARGRDQRGASASMPMTEGGTPPEPNEFAERLRNLRHEVKRDGDDADGGRGMPQTATGWVLRLSVELAAGLVVGGVIGWLLDRWWGTSPLMLIVFFLLGATAGIYNVFRSALRMNRAAEDGDGK